MAVWRLAGQSVDNNFLITIDLPLALNEGLNTFSGWGTEFEICAFSCVPHAYKTPSDESAMACDTPSDRSIIFIPKIKIYILKFRKLCFKVIS